MEGSSTIQGSRGFDAFDELVPTQSTWRDNTCNTPDEPGQSRKENQPGLCMR